VYELINLHVFQNVKYFWTIWSTVRVCKTVSYDVCFRLCDLDSDDFV